MNAQLISGWENHLPRSLAKRGVADLLALDCRRVIWRSAVATHAWFLTSAAGISFAHLSNRSFTLSARSLSWLYGVMLFRMRNQYPLTVVCEDARRIRDEHLEDHVASSESPKPRTLTVVLRRDPTRDRRHAKIEHKGYRVFWPDGRPTDVGLDAFCRHGQRLLGLAPHLTGAEEKQVEITCFPLCSRDDDLTRLPGRRVRRFFLQRDGIRGRLHFLDGTATDMVFQIGRDEERVLEWIGLPALADGGQQWLDIAAQATANCSHSPL
jgi:hypothetical protein